MPAWKREILERRKAKGGGPAAAVNGEVTAGSGSNNKDPGRTYTITPAGRRSPESSPAKTKDPAPYAQLGTLLKKRYPAVEEIEVIGGYLSLGRSCLSKTGSTPHRHLKISFNESSLHSTFEYPSESSVWDSGEEDEEDDEGKRDEEVQGGGTETIRIPRPSYTSSPTHTTTNSSGKRVEHSKEKEQNERKCERMNE
uniref:Uncharacterized protein n=1 Tax=Denticeps clupeoides TaxID=299321 RepID=A0AAY4CH16_9TELE